jgi:hypothetical protein
LRIQIIYVTITIFLVLFGSKNNFNALKDICYLVVALGILMAMTMAMIVVLDAVVAKVGFLVIIVIDLNEIREANKQACLFTDYWQGTRALPQTL